MISFKTFIFTFWKGARKDCNICIYFQDKNKPSALVKPIVNKAPAHDKHSTHNVSDNIYMNVTSQPAADVTDEPVEYGEADDNLYTNDNLYATYRASGPLLDSVQRTLVDLLASDELPGQFKVVKYLPFSCKISLGLILQIRDVNQ